MNRTTRLWAAVVPVAVALGATSAVLMAVSNHMDAPVLRAVLSALTGSAFVLAGLIARTRRPANRTGWLLIGVGLTWFLSDVGASNHSLLFTLGIALMALPGGFLIHLLLAYPSGRLRSSWERFLVVTGYVLVLAGQFSFLPLESDPLRCDECPSNAFLVSDQPTAADVVMVSVQLFAVVYLLAVVATIVRRWRGSSPAARRSLTPVLLVGGLTVFLFAISVGAQSISRPVSDAAAWTAMVVLIGVPFLFLSGLLKSRLARADISRALADGLVENAPDQAQDRLRRLLHDPTAELLLWSGGRIKAYIDVDGKHRDLKDVGPGRAVTPIAREGNALAAIAHDEALLDEPELLEQVAAAVGLEVERDRNLFDLQASERRSQALLKAIPDSMFRISSEGRILDYRVEPPIKLFRPEQDMIGSHVYDSDFPREITDRSMFLGKIALATGELQMHEYDVEIDGVCRHQEARISRSGPDEFLVIVRDVTERKLQEQELRDSEMRNRALIEAMPDNMFRISADGIFLDIQENPESHEKTPVHAEVGSSIYDYPVERELIDRVMFAGKLALQTGELQTIEWQLGGRENARHQEGRFMRSGENEFFLVVRDVSARKQQELEQAALHRVALAVASEASTEQIFDLVAEEVAHVLGAQAANLVRYEPGGEHAVIVGRWNEPEARSEPVGHRYPMKGAASHMVFESGRPVRFEIGDGKVSPKFAEQMREWGVHCVIAAPISVAGRPWGAVASWLRAPHTFPPGTEERLGGFARLVSLAIANEEARGELAASRARLVSAGDDERRRLERNLHDGAQQRLVSLSVGLRLAQRKLGSDPEGAEELLSAAKQELDVALEELRELARGIHPAVLTERGLGPALESLASRAPLPVTLERLPEERLPRRVEAAAYYVISEALANVAKYAHASGATVRIAQDNGSAIVEVADDGIGGADPERGSGLRGLADRVEALDGTLGVHSPPGRGTTITAAIPYLERAFQRGR